MDNLEEIKETIKKALTENTGYRLSKETGISLSVIQRFQNGTSDMDNMKLSTAERIYRFAKKS